MKRVWSGFNSTGGTGGWYEPPTPNDENAETYDHPTTAHDDAFEETLPLPSDASADEVQVMSEHLEAAKEAAAVALAGSDVDQPVVASEDLEAAKEAAAASLAGVARAVAEASKAADDYVK